MKKIFSILALALVAMTASAYELKVGTNAHGTVKFIVGDNENATSANEGQTVTVKITPDDGYVVNQPSGQWYAAEAMAPRRTNIDLLNGFELSKLLGQDNTWSFVMQRANAEISVTYKKLLTNADITIAAIADQTYAGKALEPEVTVKDGSTVLVKGTDYTVSYSNNTNAAKATDEKAPTVTITAVSTSEKYAGETSKTFTIQKAQLTVTADNKEVTFGDDAPQYTATITGFVNNETENVLVGTKAFDCAYVKNESVAGTYAIKPSGLSSDNYDITFTNGTLTVGKKALNADMIAVISDMTYTGEALTPEPAVTFNGMTLVKGTDFTYSYQNNTNAAKATDEKAPTVTITAVSTSEKYAGETSKTFTIKKVQLTVTADNKEVTFGDDAPQYTATITGFVNNETESVLVGTKAFDCAYVKNESVAGTYAIKPSGLSSDNYDITFTNGTLTVGKKALNADMIAVISDMTYTGTALTPEPAVTFNGMTLVKGTDFTYSYQNNTNAAKATDEKAPTVTITAVSTSEKYAGETSKTFTIQKAQLTVTADNKEVTFGDDAPQYTATITGFVNNETESVLVGTKAFDCAYVKNESVAGTYAIKPSGLSSDNYDITFTNGTLTVGKKALNADMIAVISDMTYTGEALTPEPAVTFNGMTLVKGTDFTYSYQNNTNAALATAENAPTVIVTAQETSTKYSGSATVKFTIKKVQLTVTADNKEVTFGDDAPQYTATITGFVNNETESVLVGTKAFDCAYVKNESVAGTYAIKPSGLSSDNYDITFTNGTLTVGKKALNADMIAVISDMTYTGETLTPEPAVTFNGMTLVKGTDFTYSYQNNTNAAKATDEKAPTVTITAVSTSEKYAGETSKTFTIQKAEITSMTAPTTDELTYNGQDQALVNAGSVEGGAVHYSLDGQTYAADVPTGKDAGSYIVYYKVVPDDNHFTNLAAQFVIQTIFKVALSDVTLKSDKLVYNKQEQTPEVTVVKAGEFTVSADDYTVSGTGTNVGSYMVTVTAKSTAKNFTGSKPVQFSIVAKTVGLTWSNTTLDANGKELLPELTLTGIEEGDACTATVTGAASTVGKHTAKVTALSNENYTLPETTTCDFTIVRDMSNLFSNSYEWATYVAQEDLATPEGMEAYVVNKVTTTTIEAKAVSYIPVGTGILLKRTDKTANTFKGTAYEGTPENIASLLKGSATEASKLADYKDFVLYCDEFVMSSANTIPAGRAYLPAAEVPANATRLIIDFEGETTGLSEELRVKSEEFAPAQWYTVDGRKLQGKPTKKGMYILNGKKVVVK